MPRQYYIQTQADIAGPFVPTPVDFDICQCLPQGGVWLFANGAWQVVAVLPVVGNPLASIPWGSLSGALSDQSDLQAVLDTKGTSDFSGAYNDLTGKPTLGTAAATAIGDYATSAQGVTADSAVQPARTVNGHALSSDVTVTKGDVGLGNTDNTSDVNKPVSTAQQTALNLKANLASPTFTGTVAGVTKSMVGLGSVDNTSDASKPVSTATQTALDLKATIASPTLTGTPAAPVAANNTDTTQLATTSFVQRARRSAIATADLAIANTETVVCQVTCAANELVAGSTFMFRAYATRAGTQSIASVTRIRIGTTALTGNIAGTCTTPADALAVPHILEGMVTIRTAGSGGTALGSIGVEAHLAAVTITKAINPLTATVAVDTTVANMIVAVTFISGHASNTWTFRNAAIWRVN